MPQFILMMLMIAAASGVSRPLHAKPAAAAPEALNDQEKRIFLTQMRNTLASVHTVKMTITQRRVLKQFMDELKATGVFYFKLPDKLRWETSTPYKSIIIYNDKKVGKFNFEDGKWRKLEFGAADFVSEIMSNIIGWSRGQFEDTEEIYGMQVFKGYKVILTPKDKGIAKILNTITLDIDETTFHVRKVTMQEAKGDFVEISFSAAVENQPLPDQLFDLKSPTS